MEIQGRQDRTRDFIIQQLEELKFREHSGLSESYYNSAIEDAKTLVERGFDEPIDEPELSDEQKKEKFHERRARYQ